ncbi:PAP2 superfamily [Leminorella richardii]|uniref:PAP2 superfamily n=2 Tax=Leminorella richardii TaxID=158841 RepID=A0A2X4U8G4_9GAMM|nr:PAP2 superfamily [Leminorella richardii]
MLERLKFMLIGWGTVGVVYTLSDRLQGEGFRLTPWRIDSLIPFSSGAVWLYLSFFLIVPLGYLLTPPTRLRWLSRAMQLSALGAGAVYLLWPTTIDYPQYTGEGFTRTLVDALLTVDSSQNCFPSLHVALTMLAVWAIAQRRQTFLTVASVVWAVAIAFSILQLRRHLFIDLLGGAILVWGCGWLAVRWEIYSSQNREIIHE